MNGYAFKEPKTEWLFRGSSRFFRVGLHYRFTFQAEICARPPSRERLLSTAMDKPAADTVAIRSEQDFSESFFAPDAPGWTVEFGARTDVGRRRSRNEDHYAVFRFRRGAEVLLANLSSSDFRLADSYSHALVVADGIGGMNSGDLASQLALQTMVDLAGQATSWVMKLTDFDQQQIEQRVSAYVQRMHATLREVGSRDPATENMGTTWTSAHLLGRTAVIVHLGDSRAYLYRNARLHQVTRDDTMAQALIDSGVRPEQVLRFGHILLNCMGGTNDVAQASIHHFELETGDRILLCSDGLTDLVSDQEIGSVLDSVRTPQAACDQLVQRALDQGGRDNITVVIAALEDPAETKSEIIART